MNERENDIFEAGIFACQLLSSYIAGTNTTKLTFAQIEHAKSLIRTCSAKSFYFLAKYVLGFDKLSSTVHREWCDKHQDDWQKFKYLGRLKPRGTFKTTVYAEAFIFWIWATVSPRIKFFYTSASQALIDEVSSHMRNFIDEKRDSLYSFVFDIRKDPEDKNTEDIINIVGRDKSSKGFSLIFRTAGGSTNGVHPNIIVADDPMDKEDRESESVRAHKLRWFESLIPLLVPFYLEDRKEIEKIIVIATRWHLNDLVASLQKKTDWNFEVESCYNSDGSPRFPDILPEEKLKEIRGNISEVFYSCQYLNNPLPEGLQIFREDKLHLFNIASINIENGINYCFFDPSKGKKGSDFPAPIWVNLINGRKYIFDAIDVKQDLDDLIKLIAKMNKEYKSKIMIFETNGCIGLEDSILRAHQDVGYHIAIEGIHETRNKHERIMSIQPDLYRPNNFYFRSDFKKYYPEMMNQIIFFPAWEHDDFPDIVEKAVTWLIKFSPGEFLNQTQMKTLTGTKNFAGSIKSTKKW